MREFLSVDVASALAEVGKVSTKEPAAKGLGNHSGPRKPDHKAILARIVHNRVRPKVLAIPSIAASALRLLLVIFHERLLDLNGSFRINFPPLGKYRPVLCQVLFRKRPHVVQAVKSLY
jgi:hypothetical protein